MAVDIATVRLAGEWWRELPAGLDPGRRPDPPRDARWQRGEVVDAVYLADSPETAWAEWYRWLAEAGVPSRAGLPRALWRVEVGVERVADLRTPEALEAVGLAEPRPDRGEWPRFQRVGEQLHADGLAAIVAPSAARGGGLVLCVFWPLAESGELRWRLDETVAEGPLVPRGLRT